MGRKSRENEPAYTNDQLEGSGDDSSSESGHWGYGASHFQATPPSMTSTSHDSEDTRVVGVNLTETILQYKRTPDDFYLNIILAALKSNVEVNDDVFLAASQCPVVIKALMDSVFVSKEDPELQHLVQSEIDRILCGDPYKSEFIAPSEAEYLRSLCSLPSARVNERQRVLLRYSGFSFIQIAADYPHILSDLSSTYSLLFQVGFFIQTVCLRLGWVTTLLLTPAIICSALYWFLNVTQYGYWTVLCYFFSFIACVITTIRAEQNKLSSYPRCADWYYPDNYFIMLPIIPLYKIILSSIAFRCRSGDASFLTLRHDLLNGISVQQITEGFFIAVPQLVLQSFLFTNVSIGSWGTAILVGVCSITIMSALCGMVSFIWYAVFHYSCNSFGFAMLTVDHKESIVIPIPPISIITRLVHFFASCFTTALFVMVLIEEVNIHGCDTDVTIAVSTVLLATVATLIVTITVVTTSLVFSKYSALVAIPAIAAFLALAIFQATERKSENCEVRQGTWLLTWQIPVAVLFVLSVCLLFVWLVIIIIEKVSGKPLTQRVLDNSPLVFGRYFIEEE